MSNGEMQACLARLLVDEPFRRLLDADADAVLGGYILSAEEQQALLGIDRGQMHDFAASLIAKRRKRVERAYPMLFALIGPVMARCYARFYHLYPAKPGQAYSQDVLDFGAFMEETLSDLDGVPAYASDVAKYERLCFVTLETVPPAEPRPRGESGPEVLSGMDARPRLRPDVEVAEFAYDVAALDGALAGEPPVLEPSACCILFHSGAGTDGLHMQRVNPPTKVIIDLCDGSRTTTQVIAEAEARLGTGGLALGVVQAIDRLLASGVLSITPAAPTRAEPRARALATTVESLRE
jgi:hypothetical protein